MKNDKYEKYENISLNSSDRVNDYLKEKKFNITDISKLQDEIMRIKLIKSKKISFIIYNIPKPTPRPRLSKFNKKFYVKGAFDNKKAFIEFLEDNDYDLSKDYNLPISTPCKLEITTYAPIPSSMNRIEKLLAELGLISNISRPDWDNLGKTYSDMIIGKLILDDSLFTDVIVKKRYSFKPRIEITLTYKEILESKYNETKVVKWKEYGGVTK